jgi:hypothetical protein
MLAVICSQNKEISKSARRSLTLQTITDTLTGFTDIFVFAAGACHDIDDVPCLTIGRTIENGLITIDEAMPFTGTESHGRLLSTSHIVRWYTQGTIVAWQQWIPGIGFFATEQTFVRRTWLGIAERARLHEEQIG